MGICLLVARPGLLLLRSGVAEVPRVRLAEASNASFSGSAELWVLRGVDRRRSEEKEEERRRFRDLAGVIPRLGVFCAPRRGVPLTVGFTLTRSGCPKMESRRLLLESALDLDDCLGVKESLSSAFPKIPAKPNGSQACVERGLFSCDCRDRWGEGRGFRISLMGIGWTGAFLGVDKRRRALDPRDNRRPEAVRDFR